jgi:hypothetical protein
MVANESAETSTVKPVSAEPLAAGMLQLIEAVVAFFEVNVGAAIAAGNDAASAALDDSE